MQGVDGHTIEFLLREFLSEQKRLASEGITLESVYTIQKQLRTSIDRVIADQIAHGMRLDRYGRDIRDIQRKMSGDDPSEDSGIHRGEEMRRAMELVELRNRVEETTKALEEEKTNKRNSGIWWKQQRWLLFFGVIMAIFSTLLTIGAGIVVWYITRH